MSVFTGFKTYKAPVFTVTCPQSGYQFEVRGLNVGENIRIKESLITQNRLGENVLDITWDVVQKETLPKHIKSKDDFAKFTTTNDRNAIIYGIYYATFGADKEYELSCGACNSNTLAKIDYADFFDMNPYPFAQNIIESYKVAKLEGSDNHSELMDSIIEEDSVKSILKEFTGNIPPKGQPEVMARTEAPYADFFEFFDSKSEDIKLSYDNTINILHEINKKESLSEKLTTSELIVNANENDIFNKRVEIKLPKSGVVVIIKAPTVYEEIELFNKLTFVSETQMNLATDVLFIDRFEEYVDGKSSPIQVIDHKTDVLTAYKTLPIEDRNVIIDRYEEEFGQYDIRLKIKWTCTNKNCSHVNELEVDIIAQFFRTLNGTR
jgi:hypothetical protein